ncbi:hypothetical protein Y032_0083g1626 [Ancylostoma ceylanicum]|uniref:Uncharacterized protein n=1 Tax=Ancylostoma ceylanicum TaxID=53326 RepID=A0A016TQ74_9BILA|nr:hypothetical protein Y032_0083g1626 [Ancylostoma ceylanicum]
MSVSGSPVLLLILWREMKRFGIVKIFVEDVACITYECGKKFIRIHVSEQTLLGSAPAFAQNYLKMPFLCYRILLEYNYFEGFTKDGVTRILEYRSRPLCN